MEDDLAAALVVNAAVADVVEVAKVDAMAVVAADVAAAVDADLNVVVTAEGARYRYPIRYLYPSIVQSSLELCNSNLEIVVHSGKGEVFKII